MEEDMSTELGTRGGTGRRTGGGTQEEQEVRQEKE
jgi:hypothetical protein